MKKQLKSPPEILAVFIFEIHDYLHDILINLNTPERDSFQDHLLA